MPYMQGLTKKKIYRKKASYLMEYWMIPTSIIYVWKEERPEKPVMATKIVPKFHFDNSTRTKFMIK
jgi:hypothetical protein